MSKAASDTLEKVSGEFEEEVLADLQEGKGQALAQIETSKRDATEAAGKIVQNGLKQAESLKRQIIGSAELEVRNAQLKAMEEAVNDAFSSAVKSIARISPSRYEKCIAELIKEGTEAIGPHATVACSAEDREAVSAVIRKLNKGPVKLTLGKGNLDTAGGVSLQSSDGSVRFDNTFEARLERMKADLRKDVAALLGGSR